MVLLLITLDREGQSDLPAKEVNNLRSYSPQAASSEELSAPSFTSMLATADSQNREVDSPAPESINASVDVEEHNLDAVASPMFERFTSEHPKYMELLQQYEADSGPFIFNDVIYMPQFKGKDIFFVGFTEETVDVGFTDPDQYLELLVADFSAQTIDEPWDSNWGELQGIEAMTINYQYCKTATCLVHASYSSMDNVIAQVEDFKANNPELYIEEHIMTNGSMVLKYSRL